MLDCPGGRQPGSGKRTAARAKGGLLVVGGFVALLFAIELVNMLTLHALNGFSDSGRGALTASWTSSPSRCCTQT